MLVFVDESGDPGFRTDRGASPVFVVAMVIFRSGEDAEQTQETIETSEARRIHKTEFKFSKCSDDVRDLFFNAVRSCPFVVRAIVVRKEIIHSDRLKSDKARFYEYFVKQMMQFANGVLDNARVVIDGSGDREFRRRLNAALRRRLGTGVIREIRFKRSDCDALVQLADMCAGAIARSYRTDRPDPGRWRKLLRTRISDVWDFA